MFCVAICDDEKVICEQIENYLRTYIKEGKIKTEKYYSSEKLYEDLSEGLYYDLIFLDIEFQNMSGIELGHKIRTCLKDEKTHIVYISFTKEHVMKLFEIRPFNFLVKPIDENELVETLDKAMELTAVNDRCYEFQSGNSLFRIPFREIMFFESSGRKVILYTLKRKYEIYKKLDEIELEISTDFIRIHKSYLINENYVTKWTYEKITLRDEKVLAISRSYRKAVRKTLLNEL